MQTILKHAKRLPSWLVMRISEKGIGETLAFAAIAHSAKNSTRGITWNQETIQKSDMMSGTSTPRMYIVINTKAGIVTITGGISLERLDSLT